jgi:hypothetical protein
MANPDELKPLRPLAALIFGSRWLQLPLYLGLIVAQCVYVYKFIKELTHLVLEATNFNEQQIMLIVLGLIDVVMIANLLVMVIVGGFETFVSRLNLAGFPPSICCGPLSRLAILAPPMPLSPKLASCGRPSSTPSLSSQLSALRWWIGCPPCRLG